MIRWLAALLVFALCGFAGCEGGDRVEPLWGASPAEGLDLRAALSAERAPLLGDVELTIDLFEATGREVGFAPIVPPGFRGKIDDEVERPIDGGTWTRFTLGLHPIELGVLNVLPYEVRDGDLTATTAALELTVDTLLENAEAAVEAPAPLFPAPFAGWWIVGVAVAALVVILLFVWWRYRRSRRRATEPDSTPLPPHVKALRALARLRNAPRRSAGEIEVFYVEVSQVLRVYLEDRFGLHAPDRTTEEFLPELEQSNVLSATQSGHLRQFLEQCDLVKFAAVRPGEEVHVRTFAFAEDLVESTRPERSREAPESEVEAVAAS